MTQIALAIVSRDGRFLLLKRSPTDDSNPNRWALPGGHCELNETPLQGLIRELKEETDLETLPEMCELLQTVPWNNGKMLNFYWVKMSKGNVALKDGEHSEFTWCPANGVYMYDCLPYLEELIQKISNNMEA